MPSKWIVEGYLGNDADIQRVPLINFPVIVGRDPSLGLPVVRSEISRHHAEFSEQGGQLILKDLGSTNGTFVNHVKLEGQTSLRHGDVIHFASYEARIIEEADSTEVADNANMTVMNVMPMGNKLPTGLNELQVLLDERAIRAEYQPIVTIDGELYGYEVLGRGSREDLPRHPMDLFRIAESRPGKDAELSLLMRDCGVEQAVEKAGQNRLFMNTHPAEMKDFDGLMASVQRLRDANPDLPMVLEIHEDAVTDVELLKRMTDQLQTMDVELAFDDFGAGQARLMEMVDVPVAYLKFDIALIRGLPDAPESKRKMVAALAAMTKAMGIMALAEGVETEAELALCREMNFDLIQGYYFGKPDPELNYKNPLA
jgi:EAL domain-containing protein (putative c-di-GMP-specific phosphodiesterase class I)